MKKLVCWFVMLALLILPVSAAAQGQMVTALDVGDRNILFSNGYRGFCLDRSLSGAYSGDGFTPGGTAAATSNTSNIDISQALKVLFTQCFADIFADDNNGGYVISDTNTVQAVVWHFTDDQYIWGTQKSLAEKVKAYNGPEIPDDGYELDLGEGKYVAFSFRVMTPQNQNQQSFFAYKLTVGEREAHTHDYGTQWVTDGENHWHECACGEKSDEGTHTGGSANCDTRATCETCQQPYGEPDPDTHTGNTELRNYKEATTTEPGYTGDVHCTDCGEKLSTGREIPQLHTHDYGTQWATDGENHWHECACGEKQTPEKHTYKNGKCTVCEADDPAGPPVTPPTGDGFSPLFWLVLSVISLCGCTWMILKPKKKY